VSAHLFLRYNADNNEQQERRNGTCNDSPGILLGMILIWMILIEHGALLQHTDCMRLY
jgi:hypothetical protein